MKIETITKQTNGSETLRNVEEETAVATLETNIVTEQVESGSENAETQETETQETEETSPVEEVPQEVVETTRETEETGATQQVEANPPEQEAKPVRIKLKSKGKCSAKEMQALSPVQVVGLSRTEQLQAHLGLFDPDDLVCLLTKTKTYASGRKGFRFPGTTIKCKYLVEHADELCESGTLTSEFGSAIRVNAVSKVGSGTRETHKDLDVKKFGNLVIETDYPSIKRQLFFIGQMPERITSIVATGGRGFHVTIQIDAKDKEEYNKVSSGIYAKYDCLTVCQKSRNPSRTLRIAGGVRYSESCPNDEVVQRLIYLNNNPDGQPILSSDNDQCPLSM